MNPWALVLISLGLILIIIGFKGTQHSVRKAVQGVAPKALRSSK